MENVTKRLKTYIFHAPAHDCQNSDFVLNEFSVRRIDPTFNFFLIERVDLEFFPERNRSLTAMGLAVHFCDRKNSYAYVHFLFTGE